MPLDLEDFREKTLRFFGTFFSLITAVCSCIGCFVYVIGVLRFVNTQQTFYRTEVAHFIGMLFAIASTLGYLALFFVAKKSYRVLYLLTFIIVLSLFLVSHSLGLVAPTVDDCDELGVFINGFVNRTYTDASNIGNSLRGGNVTEIRGSLGQSLGNCVDSELIFAGAFLLLVFQMVTLFDLQRTLIGRVKSKTYGERFVEMGIK